jgi:hypothetical protein
LYLSTFESGLFWSHDSGRSFELLNNQFSEWSIVKLVGSGNLLFCSDGSKVYFSSDLGMNWKPLMHGLPYRTAISDLCLYGNHCWAATEGKGLWRLPIASATVEPGPELLKPECRIWPVPASDYIHVRITRPGQQYQICNMSGSVLRAGRLSRMETRIELQGLPPAPYLLRWTSDAGYGVRMFVKE